MVVADKGRLMVDISEKDFEAAIEATLLAGGPDAAPSDVALHDAPLAGDFTPGGYLQRAPEQYDRGLCLIPEDAVAFIYVCHPSPRNERSSRSSTARTRATGSSSGSDRRSRSAAH